MNSTCGSSCLFLIPPTAPMFFTALDLQLNSGDHAVRLPILDWSKPTTAVLFLLPIQVTKFQPTGQEGKSTRKQSGKVMLSTDAEREITFLSLDIVCIAYTEVLQSSRGHEGNQHAEDVKVKTWKAQGTLMKWHH